MIQFDPCYHLYLFGIGVVHKTNKSEAESEYLLIMYFLSVLSCTARFLCVFENLFACVYLLCASCMSQAVLKNVTTVTHMFEQAVLPPIALHMSPLDETVAQDVVM